MSEKYHLLPVRMVDVVYRRLWHSLKETEELAKS